MERLNFPTETLGIEEYYLVSPEDLAQLGKSVEPYGVNVRFEGTIEEKPFVEFYATGFPWSIRRLIEEDHGHRTTLNVSGIAVYIKGPLHLRAGERVTVWGKIEKTIVTGKVKKMEVEAKRIEGEDSIYETFGILQR